MIYFCFCSDGEGKCYNLVNEMIRWFLLLFFGDVWKKFECFFDEVGFMIFWLIGLNVFDWYLFVLVIVFLVILLGI